MKFAAGGLLLPEAPPTFTRYSVRPHLGPNYTERFGFIRAAEDKPQLEIRVDEKGASAWLRTGVPART